jgi:hypothetical protein
MPMMQEHKRWGSTREWYILFIKQYSNAGNTDCLLKELADLPGNVKKNHETGVNPSLFFSFLRYLLFSQSWPLSIKPVTFVLKIHTGGRINCYIN